MRPDETPQDPLLSLSTWRGRPRPHDWTPPPHVLGRRQRLVLFALLLLAHGLAILALVLGSGRERARRQQVVTVLEFIEPAAPAEPEPEPPAPVPEAPAPPASPHRREPTVPPSRRPPPSGSLQMLTPATREPPAERLRLYEADGSISLPAEVKEQLAAVESSEREFAWRLPGVAEAGEFLERPPALEYRESRFEQYWRPHDKDLLTELLEAAVEATTGEVRIPVPGSPGSSIVCKASLLAVAGACGVVRHDAGYQYPDPNVLTPEQDRECAVLWEQIVQASTHQGWRQLRRLYDASCRKPLADSRPVPPPAE